MKKMMKNIAAATLAVAALAAPFAARAAADGDIFEIVPVDENTYEPIPPWTEPLPVDKEVCFAVRLMKPDINDGAYIRRDGNPFRLVYQGGGSPTIDELFNLPSIGIWVNGKFTTARLKAWDRFTYPTGASSLADVQLTDFVFSYKVQAGDFALPVYLAMADKSMASLQDPSTPPSQYYLDILDPILGYPMWKIDNSTSTSNATRTVNFYYGDTRDGIDILSSQDYDLSKCNFMVKTVDFDKKDESDKYWRTVHRHASEAQHVGSVPSLVVSGVPTNNVKLYVWSENPEAVEIISGRDVDRVITCNVNTSKTATASRQVGVIEIGGSKQEYEFNLRGVAETNEATIVLSASTNFFYNALNDRLTNVATIEGRSRIRTEETGCLVSCINISHAILGNIGVVEHYRYAEYITSLEATLSRFDSKPLAIFIYIGATELDTIHIIVVLVNLNSTGGDIGVTTKDGSTDFTCPIVDYIAFLNRSIAYLLSLSINSFGLSVEEDRNVIDSFLSNREFIVLCRISHFPSVILANLE